LTLDQVIRHTIVHHSSTSIYIPNFIGIGKTFCGRMDGHLRPTLLGRLFVGRLFGVNLTTLSPLSVVSAEKSLSHFRPRHFSTKHGKTHIETVPVFCMQPKHGHRKKYRTTGSQGKVRVRLGRVLVYCTECMPAVDSDGASDRVCGVYGHFGTKTLRHRCPSVRTLRHRCPSVRTLRHRCPSVRTLRHYNLVAKCPESVCGAL